MKNSWFLLILLLVGCTTKKSTEPVQVNDHPKIGSIKVPEFNADSAYYFVKKQVDFGARVPDTPAHIEAGDYLVSKLKSYGAEVIEQKFQARSFDGVNLNLRNIIASFYTNKSKRILLASHWDTRPFADKDTVNADQPFDGANDGASGVGVLMEIARLLKSNEPPDVGIDIIFFDGEDWGEKNYGEAPQPPEGYDSWWCLGSQYWSAHKHQKGYSAYYGILLDMVGAKNSHFFMEGASYEMAPKIVDKVWQMASEIGYSPIFIPERRGAITDDHIYINKVARIPTIDIVHFDPEYGYFGNYHHTHRDNLSLIDKNILEAVGKTLLYVVYYE